MKAPTCQDIADACGFSASTVSRALNSHPAIPRETREKVLAVARQMGWKPNPLTSAYMAHLRSTRPTSFKAILGILVDYPMPNGPQDLVSHVRRMYRGFEQRAEEYGYKIRAFSLADPDITPQTLDRAMADWNIPGFLVTSMSQPGKILDHINWSRYAMVAIGYSMPTPRIHRVVLNMYEGVQLAIAKAFRMGYKRLGIAISEEYDRRTKHGVMFPVSYLSRHLEPGQSIDEFRYSELDPDSNDKIAAWLKRTRPELVMGMFFPEVYQRLGWKVPRDIARIAFDRSPESPTEAGLDLRYEVCGNLAADVLISEITLNRRGIPPTPVEFTVACQWVNGRSAPPLRGRVKG
jgi:LacI family transcriptional regulator